MNDLDMILMNQAIIMRGLAILLVPGASGSTADLRMDTANVLDEWAERTRKYAERNRK